LRKGQLWWTSKNSLSLEWQLFSSFRGSAAEC